MQLDIMLRFRKSVFRQLKLCNRCEAFNKITSAVFSLQACCLQIESEGNRGSYSEKVHLFCAQNSMFKTVNFPFCVTILYIVSKIAVADYAERACVSLNPKTSVAQYYMEKYNMNLTGATLSIEVHEILDLINEYEIEK